jgi:DNA helicase II / ATP-dependent DNA helicase PcrA
MKPTVEQEAILAAAVSTTTNLAIKARAGAAKTTTLILLAEALSSSTILSIAFNKKIAEELRTRLPSNAEAATLNSIGHRAWGSFLGRRLVVDARKNYDIFKSVVEEYSRNEQDELWDLSSDILDLIRTAKSSGYMPGRLHPSARPLIADESFYETAEIEITTLIRAVVDECLRRNFKLALQGQIDYDDQLYCSALMPVSFPYFEIIMVDEAQDLSAINHHLVKKMVGRGRLIIVGDPCQAIYEFRGAREESMDEMIQQFSMKELFLTICFRSAESIVQNARWRAPDMQWRQGAPLGIVEKLPTWGPSALRDGDAIICRNNAPLMGMALALIKAGLHPEILGSDSMTSILKTMKKLGKTTITIPEAETTLAEWEKKARAKYKSSKRVDDIIETIRHFFGSSSTLGEAIELFERVLNAPGRIKLMTGHRSKGLEFDRVFFMDIHLLQKKGQDLNVRYVIETRAREYLAYVNSADWKG